MNDDAKLQKDKTLILTQTNPEVDVMFKSWLEYNLHTDVIFKNVSKPLRALRRIVAMKMPARFLSCWLNNWKTELNNYNTIIIHASELTNHLPEYIHRTNPQIRIIYWYWNPVNNHTLPRLVTDSNVEFWTFDKGDQKKYRMKFNIQYYTGTTNIQKENVKYDVYFIGHDKGRASYISKIKESLSSQNISYYIKVIPDKSNQFIPYKKVVKELTRARAILEINQRGQEGYTLRALEALFLHKKLITNNVSIRKADFYCKDNIFILDKSNIVGLKHFLATPYNHKVDKMENKYTVEAWFNNFFRE